MNDKPEIKLIDLSAVFRMVWHGTENLPVSQAEKLTLDQVRRIASDNGKGLVAICCDGKGNWRKELNKEYKAHREKQPAEMYGALDRIKARLIKDGQLLWTFDGFEADDIIYSAAELAANAGHPVMIATHDKDLFQALRFADSRILRINDGSVWTAETLKTSDKVGVAPDQFGDWLALVGDKSDGVAGCPGIGNKKATELINKFGSLLFLFEAVENCKLPALDEFWKSRKAVHAALKENETLVMESRKLIGFRVPTGFEAAFPQVFEKREVKSISGDDDEQAYLDDVFGDGAQVPQKQEAAPSPSVAVDQPEAVASAPKESAPQEPTDGETKTQAAPEIASEVMETRPAQDPPQVYEKQKDVATSTPAPSVAMTVAQRATEVAMSEFNSDLQPTGMRGLYWLCRRMLDCRLYAKFENPEQMVAIALRGKALGWDLTTALDCFHVVEGQPSLKCHVISALAEREPSYEYLRLVESKIDSCTWEGKRKDHPEPTRHTFDLADAINHGYCTAEIKPRDKEGKDRRGQWDKSRKEMIRKTAMVQLIRILWPGAAQGLYSYEELGGNE